jgi:hypothetical protein
MLLPAFSIVDLRCDTSVYGAGATANGPLGTVVVWIGCAVSGISAHHSNDGAGRPSHSLRRIFLPLSVVRRTQRVVRSAEGSERSTEYSVRRSSYACPHRTTRRVAITLMATFARRCQSRNDQRPFVKVAERPRAVLESTRLSVRNRRVAAIRQALGSGGHRPNGSRTPKSPLAVVRWRNRSILDVRR